MGNKAEKGRKNHEKFIIILYIIMIDLLLINKKIPKEFIKDNKNSKENRS